MAREILESLPIVLAVTFIFGGWIIVAVVNSIWKNWRKAKESEHLCVLKQDMIQRGMSVEEIERIVRAGRPEPDEEAAALSGAASGPIRAMIENDMDAEGIERVVRAGVQSDETQGEIIRAMAEHGYDGDAVAKVVEALNERARRAARFPDHAPVG